MAKRGSRGWLVKASRDLRAVEAVMSIKPPLLDVAGFHCQQAIEKCFKYYLSIRRQKIRKIHDLGELHDLVLQAGWSFDLKTSALDRISYCAVIVRYPEADDGRLTKTSVTSWLKFAKKVYEYVQALDENGTRTQE